MTRHLGGAVPRPQTVEHLREHSRACARSARELRAQGLPLLARRAARQARYYRDRAALKARFDGAGQVPPRSRGRSA
jgi:hypothetical protein